MLVAKTLPNLIGGISQQSPPLRLINQLEKQENLSASIVNGLQNRSPFILKSKQDIKEALYVKADRDDTTPYDLLISPTALTVTDKNGTVTAIQLNAEAKAYLSLPAGVSPRNAYKTLTLADSTFILNKTKTAALTAAASAPWKNQALVFIKQVAASTTWTLNIDGLQVSVGYGGVNNDTGLPDLYINGAKVQDDVNMSTQEIAERLAAGITAVSNSAYTITQAASTLWIRRASGETFKIALSDTRSTTYSYLVTSKIQKFSELPTVAPDGYICRVVGDIASSADDYYVKFEANDPGTFKKGVWVECAEPGQQNKIDSTTMPHILTHEADGSWTLSEIDWTDRLTGDEETNPTPSFIGAKIQSIFLFRNRLCLLANDVLCMSAAADHTNWFNETSITLSDADPIYLAASTDSLAALFDFGILQDTLVLFSENAQFSLETPDILSPKTAALLPLSAEAYTKNTGVVTIGTKIAFGSTNTAWYTVKELGTNSVTGQKEPTPITSHVPTFIPAHANLKITGSQAADTIAVITDADKESLYIYQYYTSNGSKLQSAWSRFTIAGAQIKGAFFRRDDLCIYAELAGQNITASIDMSDKTLDETAFVPCLDLLTTLTASTEVNQWLLPAHLRTKDVAALYTKNGITTINPLVSISEDCSIAEFKYPAKEIAVGRRYKRHLQLSTQYVLKQQGDSKTAITSGRWQLQKMRLNHGPSGDFTVRVRPLYDDTAEGYAYKHTGITVGRQSAIIGSVPLDEGTFEIPLRGRNTDIAISVETSSWLPHSFISAEIEGNYITKVREI